MPIVAPSPERAAEAVDRITGPLPAPTLIDFRQDPNLNRKPDYVLHIFSIARVPFVVRRPPNFPILTLRACPPASPYVEVAVVPNVVNYRWVDSVSGEVRSLGESGERFATDLLNPANLGVDIWAGADDSVSWVDSGGADLTRRGVFWTRNAVPAPFELDRARSRMERHYKNLIAQADELMQNGERRALNPEHHLAAEYFKLKTAWHSIAQVSLACPNCGEDVGPGLAYHRSSLGMICVLDWKRTVESGVKTRDDVPENHRWWDAPKAPKESAKDAAKAG